MSFDGGLTFTEQGDKYSLGKSGSAVSVDGRTRLFNNTDVFLSYSRQDPYYSVTNSISSQGSQKYLANIVTKLTDSLSAGISHITQRYLKGSIAGEQLGATDSHTTTGIIDYRKNRLDTRLEYQHQTVTNPVTDFSYFGTLPLESNDFIAARVGYQVFNWLHPYIRGQGTVRGEANNQGTLGADINITKDTILNVAETVGNQGDSTLVGLTTKITEGTDAYANIEVGNHMKLGQYTKTSYGQSSQLSPDSRVYVEEDYSSYKENIVRGNLLGYDKEILDTLGIGLTYERSNVTNRRNVINRDSGSIALTYLDPELLKGVKAYTKLELRNDRGTNTVRQWLTENDLLIRTTDWLTLTGRGNWGWTDNITNNIDEAQFYELGAGFSIRPVSWDKLNVLGKYSYITDLPPDSKWDFPEDIESIKNVYSIEGIYDLCRLIQLVGKFSYRNMDEKVGNRDWTHSDTYLYIGRVNFHISKKGTVPEGTVPFLLSGWDFAIEYRTLANKEIEDSKAGFLVELDKDLTQYIRAGLGYNFTDYSDDLTTSDKYDAKGWFVKLAGKY
jgi:hypothetical protein